MYFGHNCTELQARHCWELGFDLNRNQSYTCNSPLGSLALYLTTWCEFLSYVSWNWQMQRRLEQANTWSFGLLYLWQVETAFEKVSYIQAAPRKCSWLPAVSSAKTDFPSQGVCFLSLLVEEVAQQTHQLCKVSGCRLDTKDMTLSVSIGEVLLASDCGLWTCSKRSVPCFVPLSWTHRTWHWVQHHDHPCCLCEVFLSRKKLSCLDFSCLTLSLLKYTCSCLWSQTEVPAIGISLMLVTIVCWAHGFPFLVTNHVYFPGFVEAVIMWVNASVCEKAARAGGRVLGWVCGASPCYSTSPVACEFLGTLVLPHPWSISPAAAPLGAGGHLWQHVAVV